MINERELAVGAYYDQQVFRLQELRAAVDTAVRKELDAAGLYAPQISSRVKERDSFITKACARREDGTHKYDDPLTQVVDLVGVRIVVPLASDIPAVAYPLRVAFDVVEEVDRGNEEHVHVPGYRSLHLVVRLREDHQAVVARPQLGTDLPIEIQVRSRLQDALASFEHDIAYKAEREPSPRVRRRLVELASLLDVADRLFEELQHQAVAESGADFGAATQSWTEVDLQNLVTDIVGEGETDALPWLAELGRVLVELGFPDRAALDRESIGLQGGRRLARAVRQRRPWTPGAEIVDLLLRHRMGSGYLERRTPSSGASAHDAAVFDEELREMASVLEGHDG